MKIGEAEETNLKGVVWKLGTRFGSGIAKK
jgi:hypothetical protein